MEWVYLCGEPKTAASSLYVRYSTVEEHKNGNYVKNFQDYTNEFDTFNPELQHYQLGYCYIDENEKIITDSSKTEYSIRVPKKSDGSYYIKNTSKHDYKLFGVVYSSYIYDPCFIEDADLLFRCSTCGYTTKSKISTKEEPNEIDRTFCKNQYDDDYDFDIDLNIDDYYNFGLDSSAGRLSSNYTFYPFHFKYNEHKHWIENEKSDYVGSAKLVEEAHDFYDKQNPNNKTEVIHQCKRCHYSYIDSKSESLNYSITWKNYEGTILQSDTLKFGETPFYKGNTPTRSSYDSHYSYKFIGWYYENSNNEKIYKIEPAYENRTYYADFEGSYDTHTITWKNYDGTILEVDRNVLHGSTPTYDGSKPSRAPDDNYTYTFSGWSPTVSTVVDDVTYTATFTKKTKTYLATFKNWDGTILQSGQVNKGTTPTYNGSTPTKPQTDEYTYEFVGWSPDLGPISSDTVYIAQFKEVSRYNEVLDKLKTWTPINTTWTNGDTFQENIKYDNGIFKMRLSYSNDNQSQYKSYEIDLNLNTYQTKKSFDITFYDLNESQNINYDMITNVNFLGSGSITGNYSTIDGVTFLNVDYGEGTQYSYSHELSKCTQVLNRLLAELKQNLPSKCGINISNLGFTNV
ncbi:MAG: hypothetical protein MR674_03290 [Erysipelotrichaceae bacterium]|nr:hypothetical protein [Erysipelotrichaceae bacterium]